MDYKRIYESLIQSRIKMNRVKDENNYFEKHHIIPKSCGGSNDKSNIVLLTFKEHFIAHLLLVQIYDGKLKNKMQYALWRMASDKTNGNRIISASRYHDCKEILRQLMTKKEKSPETIKKFVESLKKNWAAISPEERKERIKKSNWYRESDRGKKINSENGKKHLNQKHSDETKEKMSKSKVGSYGNRQGPQSEETKEKIRNTLLLHKYKKSEETKEKWRKSNVGRKRSEEVIQKMKDAWVIRKQIN